MTTSTEIAIDLGERGAVDAIYLCPTDPVALFALAHGAGAGMRHAFMEAIAGRLADRRIATLRYQFPYTQAGKRRPDSPKLLAHTVRTAVGHAAELAGDLPLVAGGKSMGGRITSQCQASEPLPGVRGLVFLGFPLHAPGKPTTKRGDHLAGVDVPMLFLQGTRDKLADLTLLEPILAPLPQARLHIVEGGDHSFKVLVRSGRTHDEVLDELADATAAFVGALAR